MQGREREGVHAIFCSMASTLVLMIAIVMWMFIVMGMLAMMFIVRPHGLLLGAVAYASAGCEARLQSVVLKLRIQISLFHNACDISMT
jgi:hypothetical protein